MKSYAKISIILSAALMMVLGVIILCNPAATLVSLSWIIGLLTFIAGIALLIFYFSEAKGGIGAGTILFTAISDVIIGVIFFNHGFAAAKFLAFILGLWLMVFGVERFIRSFDIKKLGFSNWWVSLVLGAACAVLGVLSMLTPLAGAVIVSLVIGIGFILYGIAVFTILRIIGKSRQ